MKGNVKTIKVEGMMCPRCEKHVCDALKKIDGIVDVVASHESGTATVTLEKEVAIDVITSAIIDAGYEA
jgi:copper chaperone CopZ